MSGFCKEVVHFGTRTEVKSHPSKRGTKVAKKAAAAANASAKPALMEFPVNSTSNKCHNLKKISAVNQQSMLENTVLTFVEWPTVSPAQEGFPPWCHLWHAGQCRQTCADVAVKAVLLQPSTFTRKH